MLKDYLSKFNQIQFQSNVFFSLKQLIEKKSISAYY